MDAKCRAVLLRLGLIHGLKGLLKLVIYSGLWLKIHKIFLMGRSHKQKGTITLLIPGFRSGTAFG